MKYGIPDKLLVEMWHSEHSNTECARRLDIKPDQLAYAWGVLRQNEMLPQESRTKRRPKAYNEDLHVSGKHDDFDGRPRVPTYDPLLAALKERGHDYYVEE